MVKKPEHKSRSKGWRVAKNACHGRRQSMHANLFNLFLQSKKLNFKPLPVKLGTQGKYTDLSYINYVDILKSNSPKKFQKGVIPERHRL